MEAKYVYEQHFKEEDCEKIERIKLAITQFTELITKGVEIQPSLLVPENVNNLFPDMKNLPSIVSKIKQIEGPK